MTATPTQEITSPFSLLAKLRNGTIHYIQVLEDTFGTSETLGRPRSRRGHPERRRREEISRYRKQSTR
jgi:hypothetical protein